MRNLRVVLIERTKEVCWDDAFVVQAFFIVSLTKLEGFSFGFGVAPIGRVRVSKEYH